MDFVAAAVAAQMQVRAGQRTQPLSITPVGACWKRADIQAAHAAVEDLLSKGALGPALLAVEPNLDSAAEARARSVVRVSVYEQEQGAVQLQTPSDGSSSGWSDSGDEHD